MLESSFADSQIKSFQQYYLHMKQKEFLISRIAFNQMIPFNNHKQRTNKLNNQQFNFLTKNVRNPTPKDTFVCRRPESPSGKADRSAANAKHLKRSPNSSHIDFSQQAYSTNYKAFPQRSLTKPRKHSRSISSMSNRRQTISFEKEVIVLEKTLHFQVSDNEESPRKRTFEKQELKAYMANRRSQSCRKMIRAAAEREAAEVISPWDYQEGNDLFK